MFTKARLFIATVALSSFYIFATRAFDPELSRYVAALVLLSVASFFAQIYELEISPHHKLSTQMAITVASLFIGGLPLALWVVLVSTLPAEILLRWNRLKYGAFRFLDIVAFNVGQLVVSLAVAAFVRSWFSQAIGIVPSTYVALSVAFVVYMVANLTLVATIIALSSDDSFFSVIRIGSKKLPLQFLTMGVLAILMYTLYLESPYSLALMFVPMALVHYSVRSYINLSRESHLAFKRITDLLEQRDQYTGDHSDEVEQLSARLGSALGLRDEKLDALTAGAAIHDIGKIAIPDSILHKHGSLTEEEFETMKTHTTIGADIISDLGIYRDVVPIVLHEHEHWDGGGYPHGLAGEAIPIGARIVAVADVYSALTTSRSYRPAQGKPLSYTPQQARTIMIDMAGVVLDPTIVDVFFRRVVTISDESDSTDVSDATGAAVQP